MRSVDERLSEIGNGKFQWLIFLACSSWGIFGSMHLMVAAFLVPQNTVFECQVEELQSANWTEEQKRNFSIPWNEDSGFSKCFQYNHNYTSFVSLSYQDAMSLTEHEPLYKQKCSNWKFDETISKSTVITEWNLVCDRQYLRPLVQIVFMAGVLVSAILGGYLADKYGRVRLIFAGYVLYLGSAILSGFSATFQLFLVSRFVVALTGNFVYLTAYILMLEWCVPRQRSVAGMVFSVPFAFGYMMLPLLAFYIREWRLLLKTISASTAILAVTLIVMKESPRWLIQKGKTKQAIQVLNYARKLNGKENLDEKFLLESFSLIKKPKQEERNITFTRTWLTRAWGRRQNGNLCPNLEENSGKKESKLFTVVSPKLVKFCIILAVNWFVCNLVYYGLSLNAGSFGCNLYLYMFLGGLIEVPCYTIIVPFVVRFGRRVPMISFLWACGVYVLSSLAFSSNYPSVGFMVLNMLGKLSITSAFQLLYLYTSEIFPTSIRTQGVGITSMLGRLGSVLSPIITDVVGPYDWRLPTLIFGGSSVMAGVFTLLLPETFQKTLPDTAEDIEKWDREARNNLEIFDADKEINCKEIRSNTEEDGETGLIIKTSAELDVDASR